MVHRSERTGFKAGALANALPSATGEYIARFDADFVPSHDFLLRTIPYFYREDSRQTGFAGPAKPGSEMSAPTTASWKLMGATILRSSPRLVYTG